MASESVAQEHPTLYFSAADEPALQTRIGAGVRLSAYQSMCSSLYWEEWDPWLDWPYGTGTGVCLEEMAFRFRMTGESSYVTELRWAIDQIVTGSPEDIPAGSQLGWYATLPISLVTAYDLLYAALDDAERSGLRDQLERYGAVLYAELAEGEVPALTGDAIAAYAALGLIALAIRLESSEPALGAWLDVAVQRLGDDALRDAWNPGGAYDGGYGLSARGTPEALRFAEACRRVRGTDLLAGSNLQGAPRWYAYGWMPHLAFPTIGGSSDGRPLAFPAEHLLTVTRFGDQVGKWAWHQAHGVSGIDSVYRSVPLSGLLAIALWYPDELPMPSDPSVLGHELDAWFGDTANTEGSPVGFDAGLGGSLVLRSGWTYDAVALQLEIRDEWRAQSHADSSSFTLSAYGAEMIMDPPSAAFAARSGHSVALLGARDDDGTERTSYQGELLASFSSSWAAFALADGRYPSGTFDAGDPSDPADDVWTPVTRAERSLLFVRSPRPYLLVGDELSADGVTATNYRFALDIGQQAYGYSGGTGDPVDPGRLDFYGGQQLLVTVLEPESGAQLVPGSLAQSPWTQQLTLSNAVPAVEQRFLVMLQPRRYAGDPEQPFVSRLGATGGTAAEIYWSDGIDRVLSRHLDEVATTDGTTTDGRLLLLRQIYSAPTGWLVVEATRASCSLGGLLDAGGLVVSASWDGSTLHVQSATEPAPLQIVAYAPSLSLVELNGQAVDYVRAGAYVLLPTTCAGDERCNRVDDDCDGTIDEDDAVDARTWYRDEDGDEWGLTDQTLRACEKPDGYVAQSGDCDDESDEIHPEAVVDCFGLRDNDCDGVLDEQEASCVEMFSPEDTTLLTCATRGPARGGPGRGGVAFALGLLGLTLGRARAWWARHAGSLPRRRAPKVPTTARITLLVLLASSALLGGCSTTDGRTYAVTLLDSDSIDCYGSAEGLLADPAQLEELADDLRKAWSKQHETEPARPEPRQLRVNELASRMQAWLEQTAAGATSDDAGADELLDGGLGAEGTEARDAAYGFDALGTIYEGELHDDFVEGSHVLQVDTDAEDEEAGRLLCGPRTRAQGTLTVTRVDGVQGRIRWSYTVWVGSDFSACEGRVDCARNVLVEGLEVR